VEIIPQAYHLAWFAWRQQLDRIQRHDAASGRRLAKKISLANRDFVSFERAWLGKGGKEMSVILLGDLVVPVASSQDDH
jgi:hypothetical protein